MGDVVAIISISIQILSFVASIFVAIFKLAHKLRLTVPLIYYMSLCCINPLNKWAISHPELAIGIFIALLALSALSWIYSFVIYIKQQIIGSSQPATEETSSTYQVNAIQNNNIVLDNVNINSNNNNSVNVNYHNDAGDIAE